MGCVLSLQGGSCLLDMYVLGKENDRQEKGGKRGREGEKKTDGKMKKGGECGMMFGFL